MTILGGELPEVLDSPDFVTAGRFPKPQQSLTNRYARPSIVDRGKPEYEQWRAAEKKAREAEWDVMEGRDLNRVVGKKELGGWENAVPQPTQPSSDSGSGGFSLPSFSFPAPAPAPPPAPAPAPAQLSAPAPASSSDGGNPFQFLIDLVVGTTTTTTTTPPPSPLESFFQSLGFR
eukprot:CAMPEP_0197650656 /NCGR_PEP_ID=MMETSP1338-20131121/31075_1 /TAXON_ID=43686 ORGANISM="Pelagodinium beii, Strain RCC1491" /NCGR_SAMPLE_ID=MMETSP1338 /ASSEMBLY_ACC=CAM_ASM_000754 /LENGTH=174 /DNA_ID=CAMNT_0043225103 /DNA_START=153 /DNA_END=677 /DNA_ORIENTATION=+